MLDNIIDGINTIPTQVAPGMYFKAIAPRIKCCDGTTLSVQASETHYCTPRSNFSGPYSHVEVGFPSVEPPDSWAKYFDGDWEADDRTGSVYAYVPIELVRQYVELHGGEQLDSECQ